MADPHGFLRVREREVPQSRPVPVRLLDWREVQEHRPTGENLRVLRAQAGRCMDCGVPFCHSACPLGNVIPAWNDLVWRGRIADAVDRLHATNNFPEVTGLICPAPCESSCVLGINQPPVTIKQIEMFIADEAFAGELVRPEQPRTVTGRTVAVVGSGPAGLAAAQQLTRAGHAVTVFERDDRIGGLMRYGVPDFKLEKRLIDRRIAQMMAEGTSFRVGVEIGKEISFEDLRTQHDAVVLAIGARVPRRLAVPGADLAGVHFAMDYLHQANAVVAGDEVPGQIVATGKNVVIIGGGDTGSDCLGTALRQGAVSVTTLDIVPEPPERRPASQPWPVDPTVLRVSSSHEEGGRREYSTSTLGLRGKDGRVSAVRVVASSGLPDCQPEAGAEEREIPADLVILAMGFTGPQTEELVAQTRVEVTGRGLIARGDDFSTTVPGVFVAGDAGRGQSLVVWAIAEGRAAAAAVDAYLRGSTELPSPVTPTTRPLHP